ncbi:MAG: alanine dehydrogenase [bacterium]
MRIGIPRETKVREGRVSCTPGGVAELVRNGHSVAVQQGAGLASGFSDEQYRAAGAQVVAGAADAWSADMVIKVKEPLTPEFRFLRPDLILFTYLHLAAAPELARALLASGTTGFAYETIEVGHHLPLLEPMSEIAGRMSVVVGAHYLSCALGGKGVLLGGVPGVLPGNVLVIGGGTAGYNAGRMAVGLGASVTVLEVDMERMRFLDVALERRARTLYGSGQNLAEMLPGTDLLIGAVLVPGAKAPRLVSREMLRLMKPGSVLVDIAIDQGGCAETSRPTTHDAPVYVEEGVIHYCVANMPAAYARTATLALTNATLPYAVKIANLGCDGALRSVPELRKGLNTRRGALTCRPVADALGLQCSEVAGTVVE